MPLKLRNSATKQLEELRPLTAGELRVYACGPTVYDDPHIGHLRSAYVFELLRSALEYSGQKLRFVRNVTDIDDKIIEKARASGDGDLAAQTAAIAKLYYDSYAAALNTMGIRPPDVEPRATAHIPEMIKLIGTLIEKGAAYTSGGDVYFEVAKFPGYGKLSHQKKESMLESVRLDPNEKKRDALDFALWKKAKPGEPSWDSPWGPGRPGWHIECSAMSMKYLGESFDIHGGGRDLIFPHHENEIAQSEAATGKPFARLWMHHGLITSGGQKMSKSLKNFVTLEQVLAQSPHAVEELKLLFLSTHYAMPLDYSQERMRMERAVRERFMNFFEETDSQKGLVAPEVAVPLKLVECERAFAAALEQDLNTPEALAVMFEIMRLARQKNDWLFKFAAAALLKRLAGVFGLFQRRVTLKEDAEIEAQLTERSRAKKSLDFKRADAIREALTAQGISLKDLPDGTTRWRRL